LFFLIFFSPPPPPSPPAALPMTDPQSLTAVERTCIMTAILRCKTVEEAADSSPLRALDASFDTTALHGVTGRTPTDLYEVLSKSLSGYDGRFFAARAIELDCLLGRRLPVPQVVLLGCGIDARPWRLSWPTPPNTTVFEVDSDAVLTVRASAAAALGPSICQRRPVCGDVGDWKALEESLRGNGFDTSAATVWLAEGLLGYLTTDAMAHLFEGTKAISGSGSTFLCSPPPPPAHARPGLSHTTYEDPEETIRRAAAAGWSLAERISAGDVAARYGVPFPMDLLVLAN
jgi:methyltransferase (TIGR00027 family)